VSHGNGARNAHSPGACVFKMSVCCGAVQRKSSDLLASGDLSEASQSHLETLKMIMAAQQHLEVTVERIQVRLGAAGG
jgi:hypothetical protein